MHHTFLAAACRGGPLILAAGLLTLALQAQPAALEFEFDLPAGPLGITLIEIGRLSGRLVSFPPELVEAQVAPAVRGRLSLPQALSVAIQPSGLMVDVTATGTVTVRPAPPPEPVPRATERRPQPVVAVLPPVEVLGSPQPPAVDGLRGLRNFAATRTDTALSELPQAVSVVSADALAPQGSAISLEALRYVAGVTEIIDVFGSGGLTLPSHLVRGFAASYAFSGVVSAHAGVPADTAFIDRIEVVKGPNGAVAGFATEFGDLGGLINVVRKQAVVGNQTVVTQSLSSADGGTVRLSADVNRAWGTQTAWRLISYASQSGRTDAGYDSNRSAGVLGALNYRGDATHLGLTLQVDARRSAPAPASLGVQRLPEGFVIVPPETESIDPLDPSDRVNSRGADLQLDGDWRLSPAWRVSLKARVEAVDNDLHRHQPFTVPVLRRDRSWQQVLQSGLTGDLSTGPVRHKLLLGLDLQRRHWLNTGVNNVAGGDPFQRAAVEVRDLRRVLLLQDQISVGHLRLHVAAQRAMIPPAEQRVGPDGGVLQSIDIGKNYGNNWNVGALYRLTPGVALYAGAQSTIEAGRYGTEDFVLFDGTPRIPARMRQRQAGLKLGAADSPMALTLEAFQIRIVDQALFSNEGFRRTEGRYVSGLEAELSGRPWSALDLTAGFTVMKAKDVNYRYRMPPLPDIEPFESRSAAIPARSLNVLACYDLPEAWWGKAKLGLGVRTFASTLVGPPAYFASPQPEYRLPGGGDGGLVAGTHARALGVQRIHANLFDRQLFSPSYQLTHLPLLPARQAGLSISFKD